MRSHVHLNNNQRSISTKQTRIWCLQQNTHHPSYLHSQSSSRSASRPPLRIPPGLPPKHYPRRSSPSWESTPTQWWMAWLKERHVQGPKARNCSVHYLASSSKDFPHKKNASPHSSAVSPYFSALWPQCDKNKLLLESTFLKCVYTTQELKGHYRCRRRKCSRVAFVTSEIRHTKGKELITPVPATPVLERRIKASDRICKWDGCDVEFGL